MGPGQDNQNQIFQNQQADRIITPRYKEFLRRIGWRVDIATHEGFLAKLDAAATGKESVYYGNTSYELMYHVSTLMPTHANDEQQIHKKGQVRLTTSPSSRYPSHLLAYSFLWFLFLEPFLSFTFLSSPHLPLAVYSVILPPSPSDHIYTLSRLATIMFALSGARTPVNIGQVL